MQPERREMKGRAPAAGGHTRMECARVKSGEAEPSPGPPPTQPISQAWLAASTGPPYAGNPYSDRFTGAGGDLRRIWAIRSLSNARKASAAPKKAIEPTTTSVASDAIRSMALPVQ